MLPDCFQGRCWVASGDKFNPVMAWILPFLQATLDKYILCKVSHGTHAHTEKEIRGLAGKPPLGPETLTFAVGSLGRIFKNWIIVGLQCCVSFRCTAEWFSYAHRCIYTCILVSSFFNILGYSKIFTIVPCVICTLCPSCLSSIYIYVYVYTHTHTHIW